METIRSSRIKLVLVFALFIGPLCIAFLWYYGLGSILVPKNQTNNANLISPVVTLSSFSDSLSDASPFTLDSLKRKWTIVHIVKEDCSDSCKESLYNTRQTRIAVGKDANRIQRLLLLENQNLLNELQFNHADLIISQYSASMLAEQMEEIRVDQKLGPDDAILVDPLGNVMMVIPVALNPSLLLKDFKKLLKLSRVG
ncbi:MAG: hypothetical protein GKR96_08175 [Gammaproteobacteria bacterium]|nr:hypothetical protein [Gammaproteobacteria bacterium]